VQGVFFRQTALREARSLNLTGWVRNEPNGTVVVVVEGNDPALQQFLSFLRNGPPAARVQRVDEKWLDATGEFSSFDVRY
jgi:acylphosphatase